VPAVTDFSRTWVSQGPAAEPVHSLPLVAAHLNKNHRTIAPSHHLTISPSHRVDCSPSTRTRRNES
jgi:hypothetical protein